MILRVLTRNNFVVLAYTSTLAASLVNEYILRVVAITIATISIANSLSF